jgi:vacuolar-type H+-ATPase catalytic subunit A/Vma1
VEQREEVPHPLVLRLRWRTLHPKIGYRVQEQNSSPPQQQQVPRAVRDLVARWGVRTDQAQREKEERVPAVSGLETVALGGEKVNQMAHPRVRCSVGVDQVLPMQIAPRRHFP